MNSAACMLIGGAAAMLAVAGCAKTPASQDQAASPARAAAAPISAPTASENRPMAPADAEYAKFLSEAVTPQGYVRYDLFDDASRVASLRRVIQGMATAPMPSEPSDQLAFLLNAYNANALLMAWEESRKPGFRNVNECPGFFDQHSITVAGQPTTLKGIEEQIRSLHDPRMHCALVWGATSCPPLRNEPYAAQKLEDQLADQCRRWMEDRTKNREVPYKIGLSEIFKWHEDDFKVEPYGDRIKFIFKFARPNGAIRGHIRNANPVKLEWLPFDWSLNKPRQGGPPPQEDSTP